MNNQKKVILPIVLIFVFINAFLVFAKNMFANYGIDKDVVRIANLILFVLNVLVFLLQSKSLKSSNPNAFVRAVMGGFAIKMMVCMILVLVYVTKAKPVNKPAIYVSLFLYLVYMVVELVAILKLNKQKNA